MPSQIVFVCGHSNWGKSLTLRVLTGGKDTKWVHVDGADFWVRKMSNDDQPEGYFERMGALDPEAKPRVIAALCPAFGDVDADPAELLQALRDRGYRLYFWVIEQKYDGTRTISTAEVNRLRTFGQVEVLTEQLESDGRARALREFIRSRVLGSEHTVAPSA